MRSCCWHPSTSSWGVVFDRSRWGELAKLDGDQGAGRLLRTEDVVAVDWADAAVDIDTEDDVNGLAARTNATRLASAES